MQAIKKVSAVLALGLSVSIAAEAGVINGLLYNTGLDSSGNVVAATGGIDGNWDVSPGGDAITYRHGAYAANDTDSQWISSNASGGSETTSATDYLFSTTFDLTGYDASSAEITGSWGVDNYATIFLNGTDTGVSLAFGTGSFNTLHAFSISDFFVVGMNELTVAVTNGYDTNPSAEPGPMALRFDDMEFSAVAVPEPSTLALLALSLMGLGCARRRKA